MLEPGPETGLATAGTVATTLATTAPAMTKPPRFTAVLSALRSVAPEGRR
ncbi:hypothetical protein [Streptomyces nanshensis]|nr:hypothetical protein [Streptomyces nanshensis]